MGEPSGNELVVDDYNEIDVVLVDLVDLVV